MKAASARLWAGLRIWAAAPHIEPCAGQAAAVELSMPRQRVQAVELALPPAGVQEAQSEQAAAVQVLQRAGEPAAVRGLRMPFRIRRKKLYRQDSLFRNWDKTFSYPFPGMTTRLR